MVDNGSSQQAVICVYFTEVLCVSLEFLANATSCLQVIELDLDQLPDGDEVLTILRQEQAPMQNWVTLAVRNIMSFILCFVKY